MFGRGAWNLVFLSSFEEKCRQEESLWSNFHTNSLEASMSLRWHKDYNIPNSELELSGARWYTAEKLISVEWKEKDTGIHKRWNVMFICSVALGTSKQKVPVETVNIPVCPCLGQRWGQDRRLRWWSTCTADSLEMWSKDYVRSANIYSVVFSLEVSSAAWRWGRLGHAG